MFAVIERIGKKNEKNYMLDTFDKPNKNDTDIIGYQQKKDNNKIFVGLVDSIKDCYKFCEKIIGENTYTLISDKNIDTVSKDNSYKNGNYLIEDNNNLYLVEKTEKTIKGYIYNSNIVTCNILYRWELIPNKNYIHDQDIHVVITKSDNSVDVNENFLNASNLERLKKAIKDESIDSDRPDDLQMEKPILTTEPTSESIPISESIQKEEPIKNLFDNKFDLNNIKNNSNILITGKSSSGKTTLIKNILSNYDNEFISNTLIISPTDKQSNKYKKSFPNAKIIYQYDSKMIEKYASLENGAIILDDCLSNKSAWMNDKPIVNLFNRNYNSNKIFIVALQVSPNFKPEIKRYFDNIFLLHDEFHSNQKKIYDQYGKMFNSFPEFKKNFIQFTNNYSGMVINNKVNSENNNKNLFDSVFRYKILLN